MKVYFSILFVLFCGTVFTADFEIIKTEKFRTLDGTEYTIRHLVYPDGECKIFLVSRGLKALLYSHWRGASVHMSPDAAYIAIDNAGGSNFTEILLFKKKNGLIYGPVSFSLDTACRDFCKSISRESLEFYDHLYIEAVKWLDTDRLLIKLWGYDSSARKGLSDWFCVYSIKSGSFVKGTR